MGKRRFSAALTAALLALTASCSYSEYRGAEEYRVEVYYLSASAQAQTAVETRSFEHKGSGNRMEFALGLLFSAPETPDLLTAFPGDVSLAGFELSEGVARVELSEAYARMEGVALSLANACLVLTLTQFPEVNYVAVTASGMQHPSYEDPQFSRGDFLIDVQGLDPRDVEFELFFSRPDQRYLESEIQNISIRDNNFALYMVDMLIAGPKLDGLLPVIPEGTRLLTLTVEEGTCFVSFSEEFVTAAPGDAASARMTLTALANSLTGLDGIDRVELAIDGVKLREYFMYNITDGLQREQDAEWSAPGMDVDLYYEGVGGELVPMAATVPNDPDNFERAVLDEYLARPAPTGLKKPVPEKTSVIAFAVTGTAARLDLSGAFAGAGAAAPYALLQTLAANGRVTQLELYMEGRAFGKGTYTLGESRR